MDTKMTFKRAKTTFQRGVAAVSLREAMLGIVLVVTLGLLSAPAQAEWYGKKKHGYGSTTYPDMVSGCLSFYGGSIDRYRYFIYNPINGHYGCRKDTYFTYSGVTFPVCPIVDGRPRYVDRRSLTGCSFSPPVPDTDLGRDGVCKDCPNDPKRRVRANPTRVANGNKIEHAVDYAGGRDGRLRFERFYNSRGMGDGRIIGGGWTSTLDVEMTETWYVGKFPNGVKIARANGRSIEFERVGSAVLPSGKSIYLWAPADADSAEKLYQTDIGHTLHLEDGSTELYDTSVYLRAGGPIRYQIHLVLPVERRWPDGYVQYYNFNEDRLLTTITDSDGRVLSFEYLNGRLLAMTDPDGGRYEYNLDNRNRLATPIAQQFELMGIPRLASVSYPDPTPDDGIVDAPTVSYLYEDPERPHALTGIIDENGVRKATFAYTDGGRTTLSEHAGGAEQTEFAYHDGTTEDPEIRVTVTDARERVSVYGVTDINGKRRLAYEDRSGPGIAATRYTFAYDANGFGAGSTAHDGRITEIERDARGNSTRIATAVGTPDERVVTTTWHNDFDVPLSITTPGLRTDYTYDARGLVLTRTQTDLTTHTTPIATNGRAHVWSYAYDSAGRLASVDGPRDDVADVTTFAYDIQSNLTSVTNGLGHVTQFTAHDASGRPLAMLDANGVQTQLAYDGRGRLIETATGAPGQQALTTYAYDPVGQLIATTLPDSTTLAFTYDAARRLIAMADGLGNRVEYDYDVMSSLIATRTIDPAGALARVRTRMLDALGRTAQTLGAVADASGAAWSESYARDAAGRITATTDPRGGVWANAFDGLGRLITATDPVGGVTAQAYDGAGNLASVTDGLGLTTGYVTDGFGFVLSRTSGDSGLTTYTYDTAGNLLATVDGRDQRVEYTYDALGRTLAKSAIDADGTPGVLVSYTYDDPTPGSHAIGRLATMTDSAGSTSYTYDARGNLVVETRSLSDLEVAGGITTYQTSYAYDLADRLIEITYPDATSLGGRVVNYTRDLTGNVTGATTSARLADGTLAAPQTLFSSAIYDPFGPLVDLTHGDGSAMGRAFDLDGRLVALESGPIGAPVLSQDFTRDAAGNIIGITDLLAGITAQPDRTASYAYDPLSRLTQAMGDFGLIGYGYDAVGNRTSRNWDGALGVGSEALAYAAASHRLASVTEPGGTRAFTYDAMGNTVLDVRADGTGLALDHDAFGRLASVTRLGTDSSVDPAVELGRYLYDGFGRRVVRYALIGASDSSTDTSATDTDSSVTETTDSPSGNVNARGGKANAVLKGLRKELTEKLAAKGNINAVESVNAALTNGIEATGGEGDTNVTVEVYEHIHYGPNNLRLADTAMDGAVRLERIWHPDSGELIAVIDGAGTIHAMHTDHLGAPQVASTGSTASWTGATTPFGGTVAEYGTLALPDRFPGQYADGETGYRYNMFRDYDPTTGRYLQSDPIGLAGGINTYAYVGGNPVNAVDPLGLRPLTRYEKKMLAPYIPKPDLDAVDLQLRKPQGVPWIPENANAMATSDTQVFIWGVVYDPCGVPSIALLGHEMVHVGQHRKNGGSMVVQYMKESAKNGTGKGNKFEDPAYAMERKINKDLENKNLRDCGCEK